MSPIIPTLSSPPNKPLPPTPSQPVTPTVQATTVVGTAAVNKPPVPVKPGTPLRERKVKPFSFAKLWERFCRIFKNLGISSSDSSIKTSLAPFVTEVVPLKRFDAFDLWPKQPAVAQTGQAIPTKSVASREVIPETIADPIQYRSDLKNKLKLLADELSNVSSTFKAESVKKPKGQTNITGNNCYMNAGLQNLENCYLQFDRNCQALVAKDLTIRPNESLKEFENRVLHTWLPLVDPEDVDTDQLNEEIRELQQSLSELGEDQVLEKRAIKGKIKICENKIYEANLQKQDPSIFEDRVFFKLSYLLILQAKVSGTTEQIDKALTLHHQAVFMLGDPILPYDQRRRQLGADDYLTLWHRTLGLSSNQLSFKTAIKENGELYVSSSVSFDPTPIVAINVRHESADGTVDNSQSLKQCLDRYFSASVKYSDKKKKITSNIKSLEEQLEKKPNNQALLTQAEKAKYELLKITGGKFIRTEGRFIGQEATMDSASWHPEGDLFFEDWKDHREFVNSPQDFMQISLNRFYTDSSGRNQFKIKDKIPFDRDSNKKAAGSLTDTLDLSQYFSPETTARYELIGIAQHRGETISGGHYVAYVKRGDQWFCMNDEASTPCDVTRVPLEDAAVLSYRRL